MSSPGHESSMQEESGMEITGENLQVEEEHSGQFSPVEESQTSSHNIQIEREVPESSQAYGTGDISHIMNREVNLAALDMNSLFRLSSDLKTLREELFLNSERLWAQKRQFEEALSDKNAQIEYLYRELSKAEQERDDLKRENEELQMRSRLNESSFEKQRTEMNVKISKYQNEGTRFLTSQSDFVRLQMENEIVKADLNKLAQEVNSFKKLNYDLETQNEELRKIVKENRDLSLNNETSMLNLGVPAYKSQLTLNIDDFNALGLSKDALNIDANTIYEFCRLLLDKLKETQNKIKYYEENDFERKATQTREENIKLKEDLTMLERLRDNLININKDLQAKNEELVETSIRAARIDEVLTQKEAECRSKDDIILQKDRIIQELQRLVEIYESQIFTKEHLKDADQMEEEIGQDESKENLIERYNKLKQEWVVLMKDYKDLRQVIKGYQEKDTENAEKYEESFLNSLIREINKLKETNKKLEEDCNKYYEHALEKVHQFKEIAKNLLGWDVKIKNEIIVMRNALSQKEDEVLVLKEAEGGNYVLLDIEEFGKKLLTNYPHLVELKDLSFPLFFAYISMLMKPELKQLLIL